VLGGCSVQLIVLGLGDRQSGGLEQAAKKALIRAGVSADFGQAEKIVPDGTRKRRFFDLRNKKDTGQRGKARPIYPLREGKSAVHRSMGQKTN